MTASAHPASTYAVLGLVDKVPDSSGYDLTAIADRSFRHFWPVSHTLIYRELKRLADLGWVIARRVEQQVAPDKSTYRITPAGSRALVGWLHADAPLTTTYRSSFMLRFFLAHAMRPARVSDLLAEYRATLTEQRDELEAVLARIEGVSTARLARLSALHGIRTLTAQLGWIDDVAAELAPDPTVRD